jgi:ABC-type dipeptide/oligopeptide/nickel transport system permease component
VSVRAYLVRRFALLLLVLVGVSVITFLLVRVVPSDPAAIYAGPRARAPQIAEARRILGLDRPLYEQYGIYVRDLVQGDWGTSIRTRRPVLNDILRFLPYSLQLIGVSLLISIVVGVSLGALTAHMKGRWIDHVTRVFAIGGVSLPSFFLAIVLQIIFFRALGLLPVSGELDIAVAQAHPVTQITGMTAVDALITGNFVAFFNAMEHLILPALTLAAFSAGVITRMTRSAMLETMGQDHIRMAKAMGVPTRVVVLRLALKNAMAPVLTVIGLEFAYLLVGTFFVERIFALPGLGTYATTSMLSLDYPAIMGVTLLLAFIYVAVNLVIDMVIAKLDPRVVLS